MKAKIAFDFYHDGINPTHYEPGDSVPDDENVPAEWVEADEPVEVDEPGDSVPDKAVKGGKRK